VRILTNRIADHLWPIRHTSHAPRTFDCEQNESPDRTDGDDAPKQAISSVFAAVLTPAIDTIMLRLPASPALIHRKLSRVHDSETNESRHHARLGASV
jgi:hypothetical protein